VPGPLQWNIAHLKSSAPDVAANALVLVLDNSGGREGYVLRDEDARRLAEQILHQLTGLHIASTIDTPNGSFHKPSS
jgi:hypothetical protein